jgi:hypothetical protein
MTVHGVAAPRLDPPSEHDLRRRTQRGRWKMLAVLAVCAAPVVASYFTYFVIRPEGRSNYGQLIQPTRGFPDITLRKLNGDVLPVKSLRGQWLLITVGPSSCDSACDKRLFMQRQLREMLGRERDRVEKIWLVTDDKPFPAPLRAAVEAAPSTTALRVDGAAVAAWLTPATGQALEDHLYVVDPMGEWMMRLPVNPDPARVKRDLDKLLRASSFWDKAGR